MNSLIQIDPAQQTQWSLPQDWPALTPHDIARARPDAHWLLIDGFGMAQARASLWWSQAPALAGERPGLIGHFAAVDAAAGAQMLEHAASRLKQAGASLAIGPLDGNTWESYRCVIESDGSPPFPLEPPQHAHWPKAFSVAGFRPWARYGSALCVDLAAELRRFDALADRLAQRSALRLRPLERSQWQQEMRLLHRMSSQGFTGSRLIAPINEANFVQRFQHLLAKVAPELAWIAEAHGQPAGFVIGLQGVGPVWHDSLIVKTLCALPSRNASGVGLLLMHRLLQGAQSHGLRRAVLALMDDTNLSSKMVARRMRSSVFRRYALFARSLV